MCVKYRLNGRGQGAKVEVRVRQDLGQLHFASVPGAKRARHAWVPRWHFDMVLDASRWVDRTLADLAHQVH